MTGPGESAGPWPRELQERSTRRRRSRDRRASTLALFLAGLLLLLRRPTAAMEPSDDMVPFDLLGLAILFLTLVVPVVAVTFRMLERPEDRVD